MFFCSYFCVICVLFFCRKFQICFIHQTKKIVSPEKISIFIANQLGRRSTAKIERGLGTERARLTKIESDLCIERARQALLEALVLNVQDQALLEALAQNVQDQALLEAFGFFFVKTSIFDSKSPLVIVKLGVDFRKIPYLL